MHSASRLYNPLLRIGAGGGHVWFDEKRGIMECWEPGAMDIRVPRGYIPVIVGVGAETERFLVSVRLINHPCIVGLLDLAAREFGYAQRGVLSIPCDARCFRRVLEVASETV